MIKQTLTCCSIWSVYHRYEAHGAHKGQDGLALFYTIKLDLIVLDMRMPMMDGFEMTQQLRQRKDYKRVPIIVLTSDATPQVEQLCLAAGCTVYAPKPIRAHQLFSLFAQYLGEGADVLKDVPDE